MARRSVDTGTVPFAWERVVANREGGSVIGGCSTGECSSRVASGRLKLGPCCQKVRARDAQPWWEPGACVRVEWCGDWDDTWEPKFDDHGNELWCVPLEEDTQESSQESAGMDVDEGPPTPASSAAGPASATFGSPSATDEGAPSDAWVGKRVWLCGIEAEVQTCDVFKDEWLVRPVGAVNDVDAERMPYTEMLDLLDYHTGHRLSPLPDRPRRPSFAPQKSLNPTGRREKMIDDMQLTESTYGLGAETSFEEITRAFGTCALEHPHVTAMPSPARALPGYLSYTTPLSLTLTTTLTLTLTT